MQLPRSTAAQKRVLLRHVRGSCENRPGVYRMLGPTGIVLYVGKSRRLRTRLLSYFRAKGRRNKGARILRHAFVIEWEYTPTEFSALLAELRLIKRYRPVFNTDYIADEWPSAWVAITGGTVPGLRVIPRSDDARAVSLFGPFRRVAQVRDAVRALAEIMGVRDCSLENSPSSPDTVLAFASGSPSAVANVRRPKRTRAPGCLRFELGTCPGPCVGSGSGSDYETSIAEVKRFLDGKSKKPVALLEAAMQEASLGMEFERAALLRDRLVLVRWLGQRVRQFRADADRLTFVYRAKTFDGSEHVYFIRRGTLRAELPSGTIDSEALQSILARVYDGPDPKGRDIPQHDLDEFHLVSSWFRRNPEELGRTIAPLDIYGRTFPAA